MARLAKWFSILVCVVFANTALAVQVSGQAYLTGQSDHANIQVMFEAVSPSAVTDSIYTNSQGDFTQSIEPGVYNVLYSYEDFATYRLPNEVLLWDTTLDPVTLMPPLSGYLSGILGPGDFQVTDSIVVATGQSLIIQPGTRLYFDGLHKFIVRGLLTASGTEQDSILFSHRYSTGPDTMWKGIILWNADDATQFDYVNFEHADRPQEGYPMYDNGAALYCYATDAQISASTFRENGYASSIVYTEACTFHVEQCTFENNRAEAVLMAPDSLVLESCSFERNHGTAIYATAGQISRCFFRQSAGSWIAHLSGNATLDECVFVVGPQGSGGAMYIEYAHSVVVSKSTIIGQGGFWGSSLIAISGPNITLNSCNIYNIHPWNPALAFANASESQVRYCNVLALSGVPFSFYAEDSTQAPPAIGLIALTNANGDSCDTYYNIFMDPQFADTANGDYHLTAGSPCIDAGDPELLPDPDGTVADIGAFYFNQLTTDERPILPPSSFRLSAYPNPFNSSTQIVFELPHADNAELAVFDLAGRRVETLYSGRLEAGRHEFSLNVRDWPSGIYFYRLQTPSQQLTRKIILLK